MVQHWSYFWAHIFLLIGIAGMSLKALAQHLCIGFKHDKPMAVLSPVQVVLVEVEGALQKM